MLGVRIKSVCVLIPLIVTGCATNTTIDSTCVAYEPVRNYLECPALVVDQIDLNNAVYMVRCDND